MSLNQSKLLVNDVITESDGCKLTITSRQDDETYVIITAEHGRYKLEDLKKAIESAEEFVKKEVQTSNDSCEGVPGDYL